MRIVFCGDTFPDAPAYLRQALPDSQHDEILTWSGDDLSTLPRNADVLIPKMHRIDEALMDVSGVRLIQQWGTGLEGVDLLAAKARGIAVANLAATGGNADSVAEHAILLVLALLRKLPAAQASVRNGILGSPAGQTLAGRTVCLYGLGAIALPIAQRLRPFGVRLVGLTREPSSSKIADFELDRCFSLAEKEACLRESDILIVCVRLSEETRDSIGERELSSLPKGALVVNVARGGVINYDALLASLRSGHLGGVGLDVFWQEPIAVNDPIFDNENVIATPHIAGITTGSLTDIAAGVAKNIELLRSGRSLENRVV